MVFSVNVHLIKKGSSSELLHCALHIVAYTQTAKHHRCNEFLNSIAGAYYETAAFVYKPWKQCGKECFAVLACNNVQIRYIQGALRAGYATMRNAQCSNSEDNLFWVRCIQFSNFMLKCLSPQPLLLYSLKMARPIGTRKPLIPTTPYICCVFIHWIDKSITAL